MLSNVTDLLGSDLNARTYCAFIVIEEMTSNIKVVNKIQSDCWS